MTTPYLHTKPRTEKEVRAAARLRGLRGCCNQLRNLSAIEGDEEREITQRIAAEVRRLLNNGG